MSIERRRFLQSLGLGAGLLPFLPLLELHAQTTPLPRRIVFMYTSNGTVHESWLPSMVGGELVLSPILAPLEAFKSRLLVVDGLGYYAALDAGFTNHQAGMNTALTGTVPQIIDYSNPGFSLATGISVDRYIAAAVSPEHAFSTLECGVLVADNDASLEALTYQGPLQPVIPDTSPASVFERVFGGCIPLGTTEPDPAALERLADRKSVLDAVSKNLVRVRDRLPQSDRIKMEAHLESIRALEKSLTAGIGAAATDSCAMPVLDAVVDPYANDDIPTIAKQQMDILVMALACDLTRVATLQYGRAGTNHRFTWLGPEVSTDPYPGDGTQGIHALAHDEFNPESRAKLVKCNEWYASQLAYFLNELAAIPEGEGSMLDNTLVVWMNELGSGGLHSVENTPWVIAGNAGAYFDTGKVVSFPGQPHNRLLLTLCHAMGLSNTSFGAPGYCDAGPLTGVT